MQKRLGFLLLVLIGAAALVYSFLPSPVYVETVKVARQDFAETIERLEKLQREALTTQAILDEAETEFRRSRSTLRSAEFSVKVAQYRLEEAQTALRFSDAENGSDQNLGIPIHAPVDGRVLKVFHQSEGVVQAGEALIEIGDPKRLEVEIEVLSSDAVRIQVSMKVYFERWGGEMPLEGRVRVVEPAGFTKTSALGVEEQRVRVRSDIRSPMAAWSRLGDGFRVEARIILWEGKNLLLVSTNALFRFEDAWAVFSVEGAKAKRKRVQIGRQNGMSAEILSGLAEGDLIITHPNDAIDDGVSVRLN